MRLTILLDRARLLGSSEYLSEFYLECNKDSGQQALAVPTTGH